MSKENKVAFLILALFLILFSIRFIHLTADPPYDLSFSGGPYGDPGGYSFNARNKILFGRWEVDNYNPMYISIIPHYFTYAIFKIFGVGYAQKNLIPIIFSCFSIFFFFLLLKERFSSFYALLGTGILGTNYLFLMFSRVANRVIPPIFFLLMGIYFLQKSRKKTGWLFGAGCSFFLALISKSVVFYILGAVGLGYLFFLIFSTSFQQIIKRIVYLGTGFFLPFLPWLFFIYFPHKTSISIFYQLNRTLILPPLNLASLFQNFWNRSSLLLKHMPFLSLTATLFLLVLLYKAVHHPRKIEMMDWIFLSWFIIGHIYYAVIYQRVTRHFIPHIIPLIFLTLVFVHHLLTSFPRQRKFEFRWSYFVLVFIWMLFPASLFLRTVSRRLPSHLFSDYSLIIMTIIISFLGTLLLYLLSKIWQKTKLNFPFSFKKTACVLLIITIFAFQIPQYLDWAISPHHQFKHISQDLGKVLENATLAGLWAPVICLENKHKAHEYYPKVINDCPEFFQKYKITHIFTTTYAGENHYFERNFPEVMNKAQLLARYHVWRTQVLLYQIHPLLSPKKRGIFEAELFTQKGNTPRFDENTSKKLSVLSSAKKPHFVILVPPEKSYSGNYVITFRIKAEEIYKKKNRLARLDVISTERRSLFGYKDIFVPDIDKRDYKNISLKIFIPRSQKIKIRVYSTGSASLWVDWIKIEKALVPTDSIKSPNLVFNQDFR